MYSRDTVEQGGAEVISPGCAGMAGLDDAIFEATVVPVVDGVRAAVALVTRARPHGARTSQPALRSARRAFRRRSAAAADGGLPELGHPLSRAPHGPAP